MKFVSEESTTVKKVNFRFRVCDFLFISILNFILRILLVFKTTTYRLLKNSNHPWDKFGNCRGHPPQSY